METGAGGAGGVELVIKNASRVSAGDFRLRQPRAASVLALKEALQAAYEGSPRPEEQTLIYAGRVLKDGAMLLSDILKTQVDPDAPHTMHLVIKPQPVASGTPPAPTPPQPAQETLPPLPDNGISPVAALIAAEHAALERNIPPTAANMRELQREAYQAMHDEQARRAKARLEAELAEMQAQAAHRTASPAPPSQASQAPTSAPVVPAPGATSASRPAQALAAESAGQTSASTATAADSPQAQYYMMNPVMAAAYQAALAAITGGQAAADAGVMPMPFVLPPNLAAFGAAPTPDTAQASGAGSSSNQPQAQPYPFPYGAMPVAISPYSMPFPYPFPYPPPPGADGSAPPPPHGPPAPGWAYPPTAPAPQPPLPPPAAQQPEAPPGRGADAGDAAAVAAAVGAEGGGGGLAQMRVRVRLIRLNVRLLLQVGVFALILYQHCSASRFFMLVIGGLLLYLTALVPMRRMVQAMVGGNNPAPRTGLLRELQMLVLGFLASLLPGWNFNPEDAAAFAAAQEMVAAEGQQQQNAAPPAAADPREHQD
eukprot:jgi/Tetstr1/464923/TSEL_009657.t1